MPKPPTRMRAFILEGRSWENEGSRLVMECKAIERERERGREFIGRQAIEKVGRQAEGRKEGSKGKR